MNFFGNYLVDKGLVTTDELVRSLSKQASDLIPLPQIVFDEQLLSNDDLLKSLERQAVTGESWIEAMDGLGLWNENLKEKLRDLQKSRRRPLGHILVENSEKCDLESIKGALEAFNKEVYSQSGVKCDFSFQAISGDAQRRYVEVFEDRKKDALEKRFNEFSSDFSSSPMEENKKDLVQISDDLSVVLETAVYAKAEISQSLASLMIQGLDRILKYIETILETDFNVWIAPLLRGLDVLWEVRTFIDKSGSEKEFWDNPVSRNNFEEAYSGLQNLMNMGGSK